MIRGEVKEYAFLRAGSRTGTLEARGKSRGTAR